MPVAEAQPIPAKQDKTILPCLCACCVTKNNNTDDKDHPMTRLLPILLLAGCTAHQASHFPAAPHQPGPPIQAELLLVQSQTVPIAEEVVGTIISRQQADIAAQLPGTIATLLVNLGDQVAAGDPLIRIDAKEVQAKLRQAEASRDQAERELARFKQLLSDGAVTQREYENVATQADIAREAVAEATAMLNYTTIAAPFAGVITAKQADAGDLAMPGQPLLTLASPKQLRLQANVPERVIDHLSVGESLQASIEEQAISGTVAEIGPTADPMSRTVLIKVDLEPHPVLRIGRFARLRVPVGERNSIRIPTTALQQRGQLQVVFVANEGQAHMRLVRSGRIDTGQVEILSGLDVGEQILRSPDRNLVDGQALAGDAHVD